MPFGWNLGIKKQSESEILRIQKINKDRQLLNLRHQRKNQMILKKGIDKLLNDKFYREMYENYKDLNNKP